jgi:glycosyltransferase involved in cell wall biosynthesis
MKDDKITIGIPVYNVSDYVEDCIISALNQDYKNLEYIIVDDCSTDDSMNKVRALVSKSCRKDSVRIIKHNYNRGLAAARNTMIENATGKYIFFLDSDDTLPLNAITNIHKPVENSNYDLILGSYEEIEIDGKKRVIKIENVVNSNYFINDILENLQKYYKIVVWSNLYSLSFLREKNIYFNENHKIYEDEFFSYNVLFNLTSVISVLDVCYFYKKRSNSLMNYSGKLDRRHIDYLYQVQVDLNELLNKYRNNYYFIKAAEQIIRRHYYVVYGIIKTTKIPNRYCRNLLYIPLTLSQIFKCKSKAILLFCYFFRVIPSFALHSLIKLHIAFKK